MTPDEIKVEFAKHPADAPVMKAFRAWLEHQRDDEFGGACALLNRDETPIADGDRQFRVGRLAHAAYALEVFDGVLEEAEKKRKAADNAKH